MDLAPTGRTVFVAQWALALALPMWIFLGRVLVGSEVGWMVVFGLIYGPIIVLLLLIPPIVALFDGEARRARSVRRAYAIASAVVWIALFLCGLALPDGGDDAPYPSALSRWFGLSDDASTVALLVLLLIALGGWIAALVTAALGIARSRSAVRA